MTYLSIESDCNLRWIDCLLLTLSQVAKMACNI